MAANDDRSTLDEQAVRLEREASGTLAANSRPVQRRKSDLVLCAVCVALAILGWIGFAVWLNHWTDEHNASLAQACNVCEDNYGGVVPAAVGFFQGVLVVFGFCAIGWLVGYPHWYWRVPLLVTSIVVMFGGIVFWPVVFVGLVGFGTSVRPSERVGPSSEHMKA